MPTFDTPDPIVLSVELTHGVVDLIAGDRGDTVVAVNPTDPGRSKDVEAARKTVIAMANGTLSIRAPKPRAFALIGPGPSGSVSVTVELPEGSSLTAEAGFADFRCIGRLGHVDLRTGAGSIRLDEAGTVRVHSGCGRFSLEAASGNAEVVTAGEMTIGTVGGDAEVKNQNGRTWISRVEGDVRVKAANGDVTIGVASRDVTVRTARGDVRVGRVTRGSVTVETGFGALEVGIEEGTAAWVDANTKFGHIDNSLSAADDPGQSAETVQVRARTAFGDVLIARSRP